MLIREFLVPPPDPSQHRAGLRLPLSPGARVFGLSVHDGSAWLAIGYDPTAERSSQRFALVRSDTLLREGEEAASYIGTFASYATRSGRTVWHVLALQEE